MSGSGKWLWPKTFRISRARRPTAGVAALVLVTTVIVAAVGDEPSRSTRSAPPTSPGVAVHGVHDLTPRYQHPKDAAAKKAAVTAARWPKAAHAEVHVPRAAAGTAPALRVAGTPVTLRPAPADQHGPVKPMTVEVSTANHAAALRAGVTGVLLSVAPKAGSGVVQVSLDYAAFNQADGGNFGSRLLLEQLPACALTSPSTAACRRALPLVSRNNAAAHTVSATITLAKPMVLAATSGGGEEGAPLGTYQATTLKPSGSWSQGGSTGSFQYTYPITLPPAASNLVPTVDLAYDSGSVDGQTASTEAQSSWVGDGWSTGGSFIEQSYTSCSEDPKVPRHRRPHRTSAMAARCSPCR